MTLTSSSSSRAPLHTSAVLSAESARKRHARLSRQKNLAKREELQKKAAAARPHVILGAVARNEDEADAKWAACDLAKVLVRPEELAPDALARRVFSMPGAADAAAAAQGGGDVRVPPSLAFGIREREERMLFEHLPMLTADMSTRHQMTMMSNSNSSSGGAGAGAGGAGADVAGVAGHNRKGMEAMSAYHETQLAAGVAQANVLAKVVDLRNANAAGIAFENRRRVIEAFSEPGKPNDSGRTEVQGASAPFLSPSTCFLYSIS